MMATAKKVALLCPFDLDRLSGTPVRAKSVARSLAAICDPVVLATGGVERMNLIEGAWKIRDGKARFSPLRFALQAYRRLQGVQPAILHVMTTGAVGAAFFYKLRHPRCRVVFESHGLMRFEMAKTRTSSRAFYSMLDRLGVFMANAVIVMSHTQKQAMRQLKMGRDGKLTVVWGPVDTDSIPVTATPPEPPLRIGYLGNDSFWQGVDTILKAARLLADRPDITFVLAGFDRPRGDTSSHVVLEGPLPEEYGSPFLGRCHVLLSPRLGGKVTETQYPHKLSYYFAAGRPVIASDVSDQARLLNVAKCGRIFPAGDPAALADAIRAIADLDEKERIAMGQRARAFAEENLSLGALRAQLANLYRLEGDSFGP